MTSELGAGLAMSYYLNHRRTDWPAALPGGDMNAGGEGGGGGEGDPRPRQGPGHGVAVSWSSQAPAKVVSGANSQLVHPGDRELVTRHAGEQRERGNPG